MLRDKIIFGSLIGLLANIAMNILQYPLWGLSLVKHPLSHYAGSLFLDPKTLHHTVLGWVVSIIADLVYSALWGCIFTYYLEFTGKWYFVFKGLVFATFMWLFSFGWIRALPIVTLRETMPSQALFYLLFHLVFGLALGISARKWGEGALGPTCD